MMQLTAAFASLGTKRADESAAWTAEAAKVAERTGETSTFDLQFGPTNVRFWQIFMTSDGGNPGRAVEIALKTNPSVIGTVSREVAFYSDTARAMARIHKDADAIRYLLTAERLAPQQVHSSALVPETARSLLERSQRRAGGSELRGFCERMGLPDAGRNRRREPRRHHDVVLMDQLPER